MPREQTSTPSRTGAGGPPPSGIGDVLRLLWSQLGFMIAVFLIVFLALILAIVLLVGESFTSRASLLVRADEAYAYNPVLGDSAAGATFSIDQIIQSEINILRTDTVKRRALEQLTLRVVYPELANEYLSAPPGEARDRILDQAVKQVSQNLSVSASPATPNIDVAFTHERAEVSAQFLNALLAEYLAYRPDVLLGDSVEGLEERRDEYEARLAGTNAAVEAFLAENGIGEFESYRDNLRERLSEVNAALYAARADLEQTRAELGALRSRLSQLPAQVEQYVQNDASGRLLDLQLEREDLLSRYTADSIPVQEIDARIAQLSEFIVSGGAEGAGQRRVGPNPVRQELETDENRLTAQATALDRRVAELTRQRAELRDAQLQVQNLAPQYERMARDVDSLQTTVTRITERLQEARAQRDLASDTLDNVTVIEPASAPIDGSSMKRPAAAGAFMVAGFIALLAGLVRGLLDGGPRIAWPAPPKRRRRRTRAPRPEPAYAEAGYRQAPATPERQAPELPVLATIRRRPPAASAYG